MARPVSRSVSSPRVHRLLGRPQGERRAPGPAGAAHSTPPAYTSSAGTTRSTSPMASASSALDHPAGEDQVLGPGRADQPGQPLGAAGAGDQAEQDLRLAELGVLGGDPEVGAQRQLAAAAQRVAGDRGDHRLGDPGHRGERVLEARRSAATMSSYHMACISLMSAPAANTFSPPYSTTARTSGAGAPPRAASRSRVLRGDVQRVHRRAVQADDADAVSGLKVNSHAKT